MIINNDLENISHVSVIDSKDEDYEESKSNVNGKIYMAEKSIGEISLNLSNTRNNNKNDLVQIYFRNYIPNDKNFFIDRLEYFERISEIENLYEKKMRRSVKDFINLEKNPLNLIPKKNNSDLKRNLAKKLEKLNRKTEIAILEIIKENLKNQKIQDAMRDDNVEEENEKANNVHSLLTATNMQYNLADTELQREIQDYDVDDDDDISSNYDQGINDF